MCRIALFIISFLNLASFATASELYTHTTAEPEHSFQVAGIYWLPDYLKSNAGRTDTDKGGGDVIGACGVYGMIASCAAPKTPTGVVKPKPGLTCYRSCVCPSSYDKTDAICGAGYKASGTACDGKYNACVARACSEGGYYASTQTGKLCSTVTYGGRACYSCVADPCYGLTDKNPCTYGCQTAFSACPSKCQVCYADNCRNKTAVATPYGCQTYFADCPSKCQVAYPDNCRNQTAKTCEYGCQSYYADCASKCATCKTCTKVDCSAYPLTSAPANASSSSCTPGCNDTSIKYKINSCNSGYLLKGGACLSDTCPSGSKTACNSSQVETGRTTTAYGSLCYNCRSCNPPAGSGWVPISSTVTTPNVSITPTGATGTGDGTCYLSRAMKNITETTKDECNRDYKRICYDIYIDNGWTLAPTNNSAFACPSNTKKHTQSDGCDRYYGCCEKQTCPSVLPIENTFKYASHLFLAPINSASSDGVEKVRVACKNLYTSSYDGTLQYKTLPIIVNDNCLKMYGACFVIWKNLTNLSNIQDVISCDAAKAMGLEVLSASMDIYPEFYYPCTNGLDKYIPLRPQEQCFASLDVHGYVPIMSTVTKIPTGPTGT